jgi:hypothetical protein
MYEFVMFANFNISCTFNISDIILGLPAVTY